MPTNSHKLQVHVLFEVSTMKLCMVCTCSTFHIFCRPKKEGGLGVKHCRRFNLALLSKWKWCILNKNNSIWHEFLGFRYEDLASLVLQDQVFLARAKVSLWWKDLCSVGKVKEDY